jgi:murein DD-endopeptidase MepM/ murein hydrolase activator NlpD
MKNLIFLSLVCAMLLLPAASFARTQSATSTPETASMETYGQWNGLEASEILNSPFSSASLKRSINQLDNESAEIVKIPVLFGVYRMNLSPNFGDARGSGRTHEGLDIVVPKGAPIVSPTEAVVLSAGTGSSSGNTVSTANPGGETFVYMHLDSIAEIKSGNILEAGDLIGFAGNTGNAAGGAAHLHFEIRNNGATDPYPRLLSDFNFKEKISFISKILDESKNEAALASFLADNYSAELYAAQNEGITLPDCLSAELATGADSVLSLGARNASVAALQAFLIQQDKGVAARNLACTGPTGYFGELTQAALIEYQKFAGISPANGMCQIPRDNDFSSVLGIGIEANASAASSDKLTIEELKTEILRLQVLILKLQIQLIQSKLSSAH